CALRQTADRVADAEGRWSGGAQRRHTQPGTARIGRCLQGDGGGARAGSHLHGVRGGRKGANVIGGRELWAIDRESLVGGWRGRAGVGLEAQGGSLSRVIRAARLDGE